MLGKVNLTNVVLRWKPGLIFDSPIVLPQLGMWVAAGGAHLLLDVEGDSVAPTAIGVSLVVPLTERTRTLGLEERRQRRRSNDAQLEGEMTDDSKTRRASQGSKAVKQKSGGQLSK